MLEGKLLHAEKQMKKQGNYTITCRKKEKDRIKEQQNEIYDEEDHHKRN